MQQHVSKALPPGRDKASKLSAALLDNDSARRAYEKMAPVYDRFTAHHDYDAWLADLLRLLERNGLRGRRLLDIGCGTGKSFLPLLTQAWTVTACDISPAMVELARKKTGDTVELCVADMRELPELGQFDLVWALDDAVNYLLSLDELEAALAGMRRNLDRRGLLLFDLSTLCAFRRDRGTEIVEREGWTFTWRGHGREDIQSGAICEAAVEAQPLDADRGTEAVVSIHRQRHFPEAEVLAALASAGLACLGVWGHGLDGVPERPLDEVLHTKAIYVARAA